MVTGSDIQHMYSARQRIKLTTRLTACTRTCHLRCAGDLISQFDRLPILCPSRMSFCTMIATVTGVSAFYQLQKRWTAVAVPDR